MLRYKDLFKEFPPTACCIIDEGQHQNICPDNPWLQTRLPDLEGGVERWVIINQRINAPAETRNK